MATRRQVSIFINGREVANTIKGIATEKRKINRELNNMVRGTAEYEAKAKELKGVNRILDDHRKGLRDVDSTFNKLVKGGVAKFAGIAAGAFAVDAIVGYGKELFNLSAEMEVLTRKAQTVFGSALPQVTKAAEENANAMGLTVSQYTDAAAAIGDLLIPMKFSREEAAAMSTGLVDLSGALSEWTGGQISAEEVTRILGKAVLGEREELKQLGISIQEADVKARLAEKGLSGLTGELLQQAKATATLELITEKSTDAQAAFAENSETAVRRQAELSAKISEVSEKLATALVPVFSRLLSVAEGLADGILAITDGITALINPAQAATEAFNEQQAVFNDIDSELPALLEKYDILNSRADKSEEVQGELKEVMERIGEIVPTAVTEFGKYGEVLGISTEKARDFIEAQKLLLQQKNKEAIDENAEALEKYQRRLETVNAALSQRDEDGNIVRTIAEFSKTGRASLDNIKLTGDEINKLREEAQKLEVQIRNTDNAIKILQGDADQVTGPRTAPGKTNEDDEKSPTADEIAAQKERAKKLAEQQAKQRERQAEQEAKAQQTQLERLQEIVQSFREQAALDQLTDDERRLEQIRLNFEKQIELTKELEAQGIVEAGELRRELEMLQAEAIRAEQQEIDQEWYDEQLDIISEQIDAELELENEKGDKMLKLIDEQKKKESELLKEANAKQLALEKQQIEAVATTAGAYADIIGSALDAVGESFTKNTIAGKALTLIQIGLKAAEGIAAAVAAGAGLPFPTNLPAIASGIAAVTTGIASAREAFQSTPAVPQRKKGRWLHATGADDNTTYRAQYIGDQPTGYLPNYPVVMHSRAIDGPVLASERGSEYFVSAESLRHPVVLDHVRAIDNIQRYRQYQDGGFTAPPPTATTAPTAAQGPQITPQDIQALTAAIAGLNVLLQGKIYAVIDDDTAIDLRDRINQLVSASGGVL